MVSLCHRSDSLKKKVFIRVYMHTTHNGTHVEVRGQLSGVLSFYHVGPGVKLVIWHGRRLLYLPSHLTDPSQAFVRLTISQ